MKKYIQVLPLVTGQTDCRGCAASTGLSNVEFLRDLEMCRRLNPKARKMHGVQCDGIVAYHAAGRDPKAFRIWIEDSDEGRAQYIAAKLTVGDWSK